MKETSQRILEAALKVFSRDGVSGATTREIARVAKVNEVTLFRYFKNKNELLRQALLCSAARYEQVFAEASLDSTDDLRRTVRSYAQAYAKMYGKGRVFYSALGHAPATWDDLRVQDMYLGAIKWALGLVDADVTPNPQATPATAPAAAK